MTRGLVLLAALAACPAAAADLSAAIDRHVGDALKDRGVKPAPAADDAAFFRRAHLALAGRVPPAAEVRAFLTDTTPDKRVKAIDRLLDSPAHANYLSAVWRAWLVPEATTNPEANGTAAGFQAWLRARLADNTPYDKLVTELLTAPVSNRVPSGRTPTAPDGLNPLAFYVAKDARPENLATATARMFMGIHLECAQCHDHPFARWSRDQFWGLAAFFAGVERTPAAGLREVLDRRELAIPNTDRTVPPTFLDDREPEWRFKISPRVTLAKWLTAADNPFFAKATANRVWFLLFGIGIVDPVDDFHEKNPPSHPALLDELARAFAASGFDLRSLIRSICLSETFQRSSALSEPNQADVRLFARFPVQGLSPEQLFDSLGVALGAKGDPRRAEFLEAFAANGPPTDAQTTIIQALTLMNGRLVADATDVKGSRTLAAILELPGLTTSERVEAIYFAVLSRPPSADELRRTAKHVGDRADAPERYADVFWALLNGIEFRTNH